ncbi:CPBP family intramembrane glutamic endopeptidase [Methylobacterium sp. J-076]|uniref:CPBP family intramembrane glutamic endopeptidase n=1 Tax=Methylobacterium sp. J-076 TaxID=2836655 RepID=UPI001FB903A1|nr:type II CAAX endopeptidase family protein [Methylobacterium sp. J-076]MCJ2014583.1 CPBP family intramembrane metalloprotease [Methylobacterium sp. J-076]
MAAGVPSHPRSRFRAVAATCLALAGMVWVGLVCLGTASLLALLIVRVGFDLSYGIDPFLPPSRRPFVGVVQLAHRAFAVDVLRQVLLAAMVVGWAWWRDRAGWWRRLALDRERPNGLKPVLLLSILLFWPILHIAWVTGTSEVFGAGFGRNMRLSPFMDRTAVVAWLVYLSVLAPLAEELLVRGEMFHRASRALGPGRAVVATAIVFAAAHVSSFGLARPVSLLPLAFALGFLRWRTGRLWPGIALHGWSNLALVVYLLWPR